MSLEWTVRRLLEWSDTYFQSKGIDSPKTTAELLLAHILHCKRMDLYFRYEQPLLPQELAGYKALLQRRVKHEPTQYLLGEWEFWSLPLKVDSRVLIPRPETEVLVEAIVQAVQEEVVPSNGSFLDLCTGSGAIACALAQECPEATLHATELSEQALEVAQSNVAQLNFQEQITLFQGDLFAPLPNHTYHVIASNPPYVTAEEWETLQPEVKQYEPKLALVGGDDGLDLVRRILSGAHTFLAPGGILAVEIGAEQGPSSKELAEKTGLFSSVEIVPDFARRDRVLFAQRKSQKALAPPPDHS